MARQQTDHLRSLQAEHDFCIAIDSDGCVFDTMAVKQKVCFTPNTIACFNLQEVADAARAASEFVNLYSKWRGLNRFPALVRSLDFLRNHPDVLAMGFAVPDVEPLRQWVETETRLGNPVLEAKVRETGDPVLARVLDWSLTINKTVAERVKGVEPFPLVRESLTKAGEAADLLVVSQTPMEALEREWKEHALDGMVRVICGQELGTKAQHLEMAAGGKYPPSHMLVIGDAPGDLRAAQANRASFFPICPGAETESWERFHNEGLDRFLQGEFAGAFEDGLIRAFEAVLPSEPPWLG
jgi:phosphoglycolate phosphatase-like HAD superfamily hydrolase